MSQAVSLEHPILWGWQICKQTSQSSVMGGRPRLWGQQLAWGWRVFWTFGEKGLSAPGPRRSHRKLPGRQVGNKQGKHMPRLGKSCKVWSQSVDSREGGEPEEMDWTGLERQAGTQSSRRSCPASPETMVFSPQEQLGGQVLGWFPVENEHPTVQWGRFKEVVRPWRIRVPIWGLSQETLGSRSQSGLCGMLA